MARVARASVRRLGVFGGTFDPPHLGHMAIAEWARDRLRLDRVAFVPSGTPPHKRRRAISPARARLDMIRLAVRGNPAFEVLDLEARRSGPSFTVDTLAALRDEWPRARMFLLMGKDSLDEFHTWREPEAIAALATLVVAGRPDVGATHHAPIAAHAGSHGGRIRARPGSRAWTKHVTWLDNPGIDLSSSELRAWVRRGRSIRYLVPEAVADYVRRHRLYRSRS